MRRRRPECVERWPECEDGTYNPSCCRFPKSCSCDITEQEELWAAQNARLDGLSLVNNAISTLHEFPIKRRTVTRRRVTHWCVLLWPYVVLLILFIVLAVFTHHAPTCEPYTGC